MLERAERKSHAPRIAELTEKLATPPFPKALEYLWAIYRRLRRRKAAGMEGVAPIEWADLGGFARLAGFDISPWEVELIERVDDAYLTVMAAQAERERNPNFTAADDRDGVKDVIGRGRERRTVTQGGGL